MSLARRDGVPLEVLSRLLTHGSVQTTAGIYVHTTVEDLRRELELAGWLAPLEAGLCAAPSLRCGRRREPGGD